MTIPCYAGVSLSGWSRLRGGGILNPYTINIKRDLFLVVTWGWRRERTEGGAFLMPIVRVFLLLYAYCIS